MSDRTDRELRGAVYRADADALVDLLTEQAWPGEFLQMVGEAVLVLVHAHRTNVEPLVRRSVDELRERDWSGDAELADQIEAALGWAPTPLLRPLPVDLEELAGVLEGDPLNGGGRIDLQTGDVWPQDALDYGDIGDDEEAEDEEDERWLWVEAEGSDAGYRDMERFIDLVEDDRLRERLTRAIQGRGAFRRFKDTLSEDPTLVRRWIAFSDEGQRGRARAWLAAEGYAAMPRHLGA